MTKSYIKKNKQGEIVYEDCYNVLKIGSEEYLGTIKVARNADLEIRINRINKMLPFLKNEKYMEYYHMEFQGTFPIMIFPDDDED